ncbi:hypothetical protein [Carboxylicivirga sp. N1Y90]|uniref:hypothetical protein n=1 Tax=Carboxylicivirga fragile TaxID=3417571 RepID=UPI003D339333|nr:hypothetical protein [Marinilabiliaceae bacterium N1Y90]
MHPKGTLFNSWYEIWGEKYEEFKGVLAYLDTSPEILFTSGIISHVTCESIDKILSEWFSLLEHLNRPVDKQFFQSCWVPVETDSYDFFVDLSDADFPIFEVHYNFTGNGSWLKDIYASNIKDLYKCDQTRLDWYYDYSVIFQQNAYNTFAYQLLSPHSKIRLLSPNEMFNGQSTEMDQTNKDGRYILKSSLYHPGVARFLGLSTSCQAIQFSSLYTDKQPISFKLSHVRSIADLLPYLEDEKTEDLSYTLVLKGGQFVFDNGHVTLTNTDENITKAFQQRINAWMDYSQDALDLIRERADILR